MSEQVGLLLKMLLPSVAISIAIGYFSPSLTPVPNNSMVLLAVFLPAVAMGMFLWIRGMGN